MGQLTVSYERKFSDGNYGSEGLSASWTWDSDVDESNTEIEGMRAAANTLRDLVLHELSRSAAERVRWAANHELHAHDPKVTNGEAVAITDIEDLPF
jgi:hypothetical protein